MRSVRHFRLAITGLVVIAALLAGGFGSGLFGFGAASVSAASANISRSYKASTAIRSGSLVSVDTRQSGSVVLANTNNGSKLLGVAVPLNDSLLAVDATTSTVQVASSGSATALVSTVNGGIKIGDQIGVSPFSGIGMKALAGARIIGVSQTNFDNKSAAADSQTVTDKSGKKQQIKVGYVKVTLGVGTSTGEDGGQDLNALQRLIKSLTGRTISTIRIIISFVVALIALGALVALIYASIYGSIISVGRNPLAKHAVFRTLAAVLVMTAITALVAAATIFFLLR